MTHTERKKLRPGVLRLELACVLLREGESSFFAKRMTNRLGHTNLFASLSSGSPYTLISMQSHARAGV
jgi:hypothetical protein